MGYSSGITRSAIFIQRPEVYLMYYDSTIEHEMRKFYNTLSEKDKRRYAAVEAKKLGHGGIAYIAHLLRCSRKTITQGIKDLESLSVESEYDARIRKPGGG
jgi:hypothetical protein